MKLPLWSRLRLAPRLAILIVATTVAVQSLETLLFYVFPPPGYLIVDQAWLAEASRDARNIAEAVPAGDRLAALTGSGLTRWLTFDLTGVAPDYSQDDPTRLEREVKSALVGKLGLPAADILVKTEDFKEQAVKTNVAVITEIPTAMDTETLISRDSLVVADLRIGLRLRDGSWLLIGPNETGVSSLHYLRNKLGLVGTLFFVAAFSIWMARSIVKPVTQLAAAAERLGREREMTPISGMKLPEYAAIAGTFNEMQARLKKFVDERMQMLAAISHDLRTPLTRLRLYAECVKDKAQRAQILSDISDMETMVSTSLAFMSDDIHREPHSVVDVASLLISISDNFSDDGRKVAYEGPDHAQLSCRPVALKRAFTNLIDNGCKYGGEVKLSLTDTTASLIVDVHDNGPGIPADQAERAFAPFQRLEASRNRQTGGTGLGLTIARDVILGHGGDIRLINDAQGFVVRVELPRPRE